MISICGLHKSFNNSHHVLQGIDLEIPTGETIAIIGESGCGKSVLLKHIIGLLSPDAGTVSIDGSIVHDLSEKDLYALRKRFGFLFQGAALFDSMNIRDNVSLGIAENTNMSASEMKKVVAEKLEMVVGRRTANSSTPRRASPGKRSRLSPLVRNR